MRGGRASVAIQPTDSENNGKRRSDQHFIHSVHACVGLRRHATAFCLFIEFLRRHVCTVYVVILRIVCLSTRIKLDNTFANINDDNDYYNSNDDNDADDDAHTLKSTKREMRKIKT